MISVVIPSYNGAETLFQAIDSVLCQTTKTPLEILVIDDNSTDDTMEKMGRYGEDKQRSVRIQKPRCTARKGRLHCLSGRG